MPPADARYRQVIDELVQACRHGQGQIGADRARAGLWNKNATPESLPDQHVVNGFLSPTWGAA